MHDGTLYHIAIVNVYYCRWMVASSNMCQFNKVCALEIKNCGVHSSKISKAISVRKKSRRVIATMKNNSATLTQSLAFIDILLRLASAAVRVHDDADPVPNAGAGHHLPVPVQAHSRVDYEPGHLATMAAGSRT